MAFETVKIIIQFNAQYPKALIVSGKDAPCFKSIWSNILELDKKEFINRLRTIGGLPKYILENPKILNLFLPIIENDISLLERYNASNNTPRDTNILAINGKEDPLESPENVEQWKDYTKSNFKSVHMKGGHFYFEENAVLFLETIGEFISS